MSSKDDGRNVGLPSEQIAWGVYNALNQNKIWISEPGQVFRLEEITPTHRHNLINWLRVRADNLEFYYSMGEYWGMPHGDYSDDFWPEMLQDECLRDQEIRMKDPQAWLETTPLMKRLLELEDEWESTGSFADVEAV